MDSDTRSAFGDRILVHAFARLDPRAMGLSLGIVAGLGLFLATAWLLIRATFDPGAPVGPHLGLLAAFFPGYSVTWPGALAGLAYGFLTGYVLGLVLTSLLNLHHLVYLLFHLRRRRRREILDGL